MARFWVFDDGRICEEVLFVSFVSVRKSSFSWLLGRFSYLMMLSECVFFLLSFFSFFVSLVLLI